MSISLEFELHTAVADNNLVELNRLLSGTRRPDINSPFPNAFQETPLHVAICRNSKILRRLLQCPELNLNAGNCRGNSPLNMACWTAQEESVKLLLADPRTHVVKSTSGAGPLWCAAYAGNRKIVLQLIAWEKMGHVGGERVLVMEWDTSLSFSTPEEAARIRGHPHVAELIAEFAKSPQLARMQARRALGDKALRAAEIFAVIIFYSDGYLSLLPAESGSKTARFLRILHVLPMELQMAISHRCADSDKDLILSKETELALSWLACQTF